MEKDNTNGKDVIDFLAIIVSLAESSAVYLDRLGSEYGLQLIQDVSDVMKHLDEIEGASTQDALQLVVLILSSLSRVSQETCVQLDSLKDMVARRSPKAYRQMGYPSSNDN